MLALSPMQQKYLSLEGYTVSNLGQRPGIVGGKERLAWRAVRPRRWRREPHLLALSPVQQRYLSQEGYTVSQSACHNGQSVALLSDSGLVMYFSTLPAPSSSAPCILAILTHLQGGVSKMCIMTQRLVFSVGDEVVARHLLRLRQSHDVENGGCHVGEDAVLHLGVFVCGDVDEGYGVE